MPRILTLGLATAVALALMPAVAGAAGSADRAVVVGGQPEWATPAARVDRAPAAEAVTVRVYLRMRNLKGATAQAQAVSDPASPTYGQFLTPDAVRAAYAPTAAAVSRVSAWLGQQGLSVDYVPGNRLYVSAHGAAAAVGAAFGTSLERYRVDGQTLRAAAAPPSVPSDLAPLVDAVVGLDEGSHLIHPDHIVGDPPAPGMLSGAARAAPNAGPSPGFRTARPCSRYFGERPGVGLPAYGGGYPAVLPWITCGYEPPQLRSAYGIDRAVAAGTDGRGVTVAIVDAFASPTIRADIAEYARRYDPAHPWATGQYRQIVPPGIFQVPADDECDPQGWYGEQTLDVEAVHAMAPGANVLYVGGADCFSGIDAALNHIVDGRLADIVSNSYGSLGEKVGGAEVKAFGAITLQGALEGIGLTFSSGDDGDESLNLSRPSVDFEPSIPWVTGVGGTSLAISATGRRSAEVGWETGSSLLDQDQWAPAAPGEYLYGSGGGTSRRYAQPWYQTPVVPSTLATRWTPTAKRTVPDISMLGDPNSGMLVGQTQRFSDGRYFDVYRIGGTSLSSPLFAGFMALADQAAGRPHGFVNPALYRLAGTGAIRDVAPGPKLAVARNSFVNDENSLDGTLTYARTFDFAGISIHTAPGYDDVTGLGVPNGEAFLRSLRR
jgi:subtilase family serine protease